jgi:thiamine-monophosphate kinase
MGQGKPPLYALITVALPARLNNQRFTHRLFEGMHRIANRFGVRIIGGDLSAINGPLTITSTLLGYSSLPRISAGLTAVLPILKRSGAKAGDIIMVTGRLGGSILGKHLNFTPRIREALALNSSYKINSMMDISDGLSTDLGHICEASNIGAQLVERRIPISDAAHKLSGKTGRSPVSHALNDGEDFELLFTASPDQARRIIRERKVAVSAIGFMTKDKEIWLEDSKGVIKAIKPEGYRHF